MAYKYFACPQRKGTRSCQRGPQTGQQGDDSGDLYGNEVVKKEDDTDISDKGQRRPGGVEDEESESDDGDLSTKKDKKTLDFHPMDTMFDKGESSFSANGLQSSEEEEEEEGSSISGDSAVMSEELHYEFDKMIFTGGKVTCSDGSPDGPLVASRF